MVSTMNIRESKRSTSSMKKSVNTLVVHHEYHERAQDPVARPDFSSPSASNGNPVPFPIKLYEFLELAEQDGFSDIVSWQPHGRCFCIHKSALFRELLPRYFSVTKVASFQRQLNLYGFLRLTRNGADKGGYYNEFFLKTRPDLCHCIKRVKVKGTGVRAKSNPDEEPNFYRMPSLSSFARPSATKLSLPPGPSVVSDGSSSSTCDSSSDDTVVESWGMPFHFMDECASQIPLLPSLHSKPSMYDVACQKSSLLSMASGMFGARASEKYKQFYGCPQNEAMDAFVSDELDDDFLEVMIPVDDAVTPDNETSFRQQLEQLMASTI